MSITVSENKIMSSDSMHLLAGVTYEPEGEIRGLIHVVHGMAEHIGRYDAFMRRMAEEGYVCFGFDNLGHGYTAFNEQDLGFIAPFDGWKMLSKDVALFGDVLRRQFGFDLPYIVMGHSMGSFIVRVSATRFCTPDKLIIMGTGGPNPAGGIGYVLAKIIRVICGQRHKSKLLNNLAFGSYNKRFAAEHDNLSWLTKDVTVREEYAEDPYCNFNFTVSAMADLIKLNTLANKPAFYRAMRKKKTPILLVSGMDDPVGDYGEGVTTVFRKLLRRKADVRVKLYEGCRHEVLNDSCREEVIDDILSFIGD